ncbi:hypothetical protein ACQKOM_00970 [Peribacillus frigoritolerans]|uniref:hypothetical protein n=1 Tax=Peribacillus frigoritolerans TaxID=450367 RepID=UPI003CFE1F7E
MSFALLLVNFVLLLVNSLFTREFRTFTREFGLFTRESLQSRKKRTKSGPFFVYSFMLAIIGAGELHAFPLYMRAIFFTKGLEAIAFFCFFFGSIHRVHPS